MPSFLRVFDTHARDQCAIRTNERILDLDPFLWNSSFDNDGACEVQLYPDARNHILLCLNSILSRDQRSFPSMW